MHVDKEGLGYEFENEMKDFPDVSNEQCGNMKLLFIKETPLCGNINCQYLIFRQLSDTRQVTYRYIAEVGFASMRLFCYSKNQNYTYYLFTDWHESNYQSVFQLDEIVNNQCQKKASLHVDYTNQKLGNLIDSFWEKMPDEQNLLNVFKIKSVRRT